MTVRWSLADARRHLDCVRPWLLAFSTYTLLTIALTWPMLPRAASAVVRDTGDTLQQTYSLAWIWRAFTTDPFHLYDATIFYPQRFSLAFSESLLVPSLLAAPVQALTGNPILAYNVATLLAFPLTALAACALARALTGSWPAGLLAGLIYGFYPYRFDQLTQVQNVSSYWPPLTLWALLRFNTAPTWRWALVFWGTLVAGALTSLYSAAFTAVAAGLFQLWELLASRRLGGAAYLRLTIAGLGGLVVLAPFAYPYVVLSRSAAFHWSIEPMIGFSADLKDWLSAPPENWLYGRVTAPVRAGSLFTQHNLFPGLGALVLAGVGLVAGRPRALVWRFGLLAAVSAVMVHGPVLIAFGELTGIPLPYLLLHRLPVFSSIRVPSRFVVIAMLSLAVLAAFGLSAVLRWRAERVQRRTPLEQGLVPGRTVTSTWIALAAGAVIAAEYVSAPVRTIPVPVGTAVPAVYQWLARQPDQFAIVELPMWPTKGDAELGTTWYIYYATYHWKGLVNGRTTFYPPGYEQLVESAARFPADPAIVALRGTGARYLILHGDLYPPPERERLMALTPLREVARFGSDIVYDLDLTGRRQP
ncbi:MAG: hypothetical protein HY329_07655 [Chloroflexi bacterium]|nr:hypothetical protein [Chloroflexota bacterium]